MSILEQLNLRDKFIVITGAGGFVGQRLARTFFELGAKLILVDRPQSALADFFAGIRHEYTDQGTLLLYDLEKESDRCEMISVVNEITNDLSVLVNNAAFVGTSELQGWNTEFANQSLDTWRRAIEVNLTAAFHLCQGLETSLVSSRSGRIVNIGSIYGLLGPDLSLYEGTDMNNPAAYGVSKAGLIQLTKYLATAMAPNVTVNAVCPGGIERGQDKQFQERYVRRTPLGRMATEDDIVGTVVYLSTGLSSYVTGQVIAVDGGWSVW